MIASGDSSETIKAERFAFLWARICAAFPRQDTNTTTAEVYFDELCHYSEAQLTEAVSSALRNCKFFPSIAEIVAEVQGGSYCIHTSILAEIKSRESVLVESERLSKRRLQAIAKQFAILEDRSQKLSSAIYEREQKWIEEVGLAESRKKLEAIKAKIQQEEKALLILRQKVKLFDQARILQLRDDEIPQ